MCSSNASSSYSSPYYWIAKCLTTQAPFGVKVNEPTTAGGQQTFTTIYPNAELQALAAEFPDMSAALKHLRWVMREKVERESFEWIKDASFEALRACIKDGACYCPVCLGDDLRGEHVNIEGSSASQEVICGDCGAWYTVTFEVTGIVQQEYGDQEDIQPEAVE